MTRDEYLTFRDERLPDLRHFARHNIPITATDLRLALEAIDYLDDVNRKPAKGPMTVKYEPLSDGSAVLRPVKP